MGKYTKHRFFTALVLEIRTSLYSIPSDAIFIGKFSPLIFWNSQNPQNLTSEVYFLHAIHLIWIFVYSLEILVIKRQFCHFRQIRHFRQNRHFPKGPFAISFVFLFTVCWFWRLIAISAIFAKYAIFANITTFPKGPFAISFVFFFTIWRFWRLSANSAIFAKYAIFTKIATFPKGPLLSVVKGVDMDSNQSQSSILLFKI